MGTHRRKTILSVDAGAFTKKKTTRKIFGVSCPFCCGTNRQSSGCQVLSRRKKANSSIPKAARRSCAQLTLSSLLDCFAICARPLGAQMKLSCQHSHALYHADMCSENWACRRPGLSGHSGQVNSMLPRRQWRGKLGHSLHQRWVTGFES